MTRTLAKIPIGETVRLVGVAADRQTVRRLAELGLTPGVELTVLQTSKGPTLISVRGSRVAIGNAMAARIEVEPNGTPEKRT